MYTLFLDKQENFICELEIEGASYKKTSSRIILETDRGFNILFEGKVSNNGQCNVPLSSLKNVLEENEKGIIKLEVIAEDSVFTPWSSEFNTRVSKKVSLKENNSLTPLDDEPAQVSTKPKVSVTVKEAVSSKKQRNNLKLLAHLRNLNTIYEEVSKVYPNLNFNKLLNIYSKRVNLTEIQKTEIKNIILN